MIHSNFIVGKILNWKVSAERPLVQVLIAHGKYSISCKHPLRDRNALDDSSSPMFVKKTGNQDPPGADWRIFSFTCTELVHLLRTVDTRTERKYSYEIYILSKRYLYSTVLVKVNRYCITVSKKRGCFSFSRRFVFDLVFPLGE